MQGFIEMKLLPPIFLREQYYDDLEKELNKLFYKVLYEPIIGALNLNKKEIINSNDALLNAIQSGRVWYENGKFNGKFNARISKALRELGASYNIKTATWSLSTLPTDILLANLATKQQFKNMRDDLLAQLDDINIDDIDNISNIPDIYVEGIDRINNDFDRSLGKSIAIAPQITQQTINVLAADWGYNMDLYVKNWLEENIKSMRKDIMKNTFKGRRSSEMISYISRNYQVSRSKARFLARQETSLLMAKFSENRYAAMGITRYKWSTSNDERTRHDHKRLDGKIYRFSDPPITNLKTGARNNPSEDYGCRCKARAILE